MAFDIRMDNSSTAGRPARKNRAHIGTALGAITLTALSAGCSGSASTSDAQRAEPSGTAHLPAPACPLRVRFDARVYEDAGPLRAGVGPVVGTGSSAPCEDTGRGTGTEDPGAWTLHAVEGLDPEAALAVEGPEEGPRLLTVRDGGGLPEEVEEYLDQDRR
ncbi:DUF6281 family protein [Streptomyces sp. LE64]|uniref:DUF6281 family protein n=1 Tax=Streptomyces sp. LE64 TaxID=3448653 RepID=UPI004041B6EA